MYKPFFIFLFTHYLRAASSWGHGKPPTKVGGLRTKLKSKLKCNKHERNSDVTNKMIVTGDVRNKRSCPKRWSKKTSPIVSRKCSKPVILISLFFPVVACGAESFPASAELLVRVCGWVCEIEGQRGVGLPWASFFVQEPSGAGDGQSFVAFN